VVRAAARISLRGSEGKRSTWGRQCGIGPIAQRHVRAAALVEDEGHEGVFLCSFHTKFIVEIIFIYECSIVFRCITILFVVAAN